MKAQPKVKSAISGPRMGRPPTGKTHRTAKVQFCLTEDDAQWWNDFARDVGFTSRGQLLTTMIERIMLSGLSPIGSARLMRQILHRLESRAGRGLTSRRPVLDFESLFRPLPALPEEAPALPATEAEAKAAELHPNKAQT